MTVRYLYYYCYDRCGAATVKLDDVDEAAKAYIRELLSEDTRAKVAQVLRTYKGHDKDRVEGFKAAVKKRSPRKKLHTTTFFQTCPLLC